MGRWLVLGSVVGLVLAGISRALQSEPPGLTADGFITMLGEAVLVAIAAFVVIAFGVIVWRGFKTLL